MYSKRLKLVETLKSRHIFGFGWDHIRLRVQVNFESSRIHACKKNTYTVNNVNWTYIRSMLRFTMYTWRYPPSHIERRTSSMLRLRTNSLAHEIKSGVKWFHYACPHSLYICHIGENPLVKIWKSRHLFVMPPSRETPPT